MILGIFRSAASSRRHFERRESPGDEACDFEVAGARHLKNREQGWDKRVTKQTTTNHKKNKTLLDYVHLYAPPSVLLKKTFNCFCYCGDKVRVLLELFQNRNARNKRYPCSFGTYSLFRMSGILIRSFCSR